MRRVVRAILDRLPKRGRRRWRYVSGRRRRVGIVLISIIIIAMYGWWRYTNHYRVRRKAVAYLGQFIGAEVRIQKASFSLLEGIKLTGVRIYRDSDGRIDDIFQARQVWLKHKPLSLIQSGRLDVQEIICIEPVLTITEDVDHATWNFQSLFHPPDPDSAVDWRESLPVIRIRDGLVHRKEIVDGVLTSLCTERLSARALPQTAPVAYAIEVFDDASAGEAGGQVRLNLEPVSVAWTAQAPAALLRRVSPHLYRRWFDRYQVRGGVLRCEGEASADSVGNRLTFALTDVGLTLPPEVGGVQLTGLDGVIEFTADGVGIEKISGRLPQLGDALAVVTGGFAGYGADSPVEVQCRIDDLEFPFAADDSLLGRHLKWFQDDYAPRGKANVSFRIGRDAVGEFSCDGSAEVLGMAMTVALFPLPVTDATGTVAFDSRRVTLGGLRGRVGDMHIGVDGWISIPEHRVYDLSLTATDVSLDAAFDAAMARSSLEEIRQDVRGYVNSFAPSGTVDADLRLYSHPETGEIRNEVNLTFDGNASVVYEAFPYAVTDLTGKVSIHPESVTLDAIRGRHGSARIGVDGTATDLHAANPDVRLDINATDIPLDSDLAAALGAISAPARGYYDSFHFAGAADVVGPIHFRPDGSLDYTLMTTLKNASMRHDRFPCPLVDLRGVVRLTPKTIDIRRVVGTRGGGPVTVTGSVDLTDAQLALDLEIDAKDVRFDDELRDAVRAVSPETLGRVWDAMNPTGTADIRFVAGFRDDTGRDDYVLTLIARDMGVTPTRFPYPITGLRGTVLARPDRVEFQDLRAGDAESGLLAKGVLHLSDGGVQEADILLAATGLPIDQRLLDAAPDSFATVAARLQPTGRFDVNLTSLQYRRPPVQQVQPDATGPGEPWTWRIDGSIGLHDAAMDVGVKATRVNGEVAGVVTADVVGDRYSVAAAFTADSLLLWGRQATRLRGNVRKDRLDDTLHFADLVADIYGGQMAGDIDIEMGDSGGVTMKLDVLDVEVGELLNAKGADPDKRIAGSGRLSGGLSLRVLTDPQGVTSRRGSGEFVLAEAKIGKIPILLGLVNVVLLQLPTETTFSSGEVKYVIEDDLLICSKINLRGEGQSVVGLNAAATSIIGAGTVNLASEELNLALRSGPPHLLMGVFGELWTKTVSGLSTTRVTGSWRDPKVRTVPLNQIDSLIREVFDMDP